MDFFDKLGKKASETYQATKEKTAKVTAELKLKGQINDAENKIEDLYLELGRKVYTEKADGRVIVEEDIQEICDKISEQKNRIKEAEEEIRKLKNIKKCINCSEEIEYQAMYCPKCGKEQPKQVKVEVTTEVQVEPKQAEVVEVKDSEENPQENNEQNN